MRQLHHLARSASAAHLARVLAIVCCAFAAFYPALDAGLVFDDQVAIVKNADLRPESSLLDLFANDYWGARLNSVSNRPTSVFTGYYSVDFRLVFVGFKWPVFWRITTLHAATNCWTNTTAGQSNRHRRLFDARLQL